MTKGNLGGAEKALSHERAADALATFRSRVWIAVLTGFAVNCILSLWLLLSVPVPRYWEHVRVDGVTVPQVQAISQLAVDAALRDEVRNYRQIVEYLKFALPVLVVGLGGLVWLVLKTHVDASSAATEIKIREKVAQDVRTQLSDRLKTFDEAVVRAESIHKEHDADLAHHDYLLFRNIAFAFWSIEQHQRAAEYATRALARLDRLRKLGSSERYEVALSQREACVADQAYFFAEDYVATKREASAAKALAALGSLFGAIATAEQAHVDRATLFHLVDAVLFVTASAVSVCGLDTIRKAAALYGKYAANLADYLNPHVRDARKMIATYEEIFGPHLTHPSPPGG